MADFNDMILLERGLVMPRADDITAYLDPYPPVISALMPVSGTRIDSSMQITFSAQDSNAIASVIVSAEHGGAVEMVYSGGQFFGGYAARSGVDEDALGVMAFRIGGSWRGLTLTVRVTAIDKGGNVTRAEGTWPLADAVLPIEPYPEGDYDRVVLSRLIDAGLSLLPPGWAMSRRRAGEAP